MFTCESLATIFHLEHVEMKEIAVKLFKIISGTQLTVKHKISPNHAISIILMASKIAEAD